MWRQKTNPLASLEILTLTHRKFFLDLSENLNFKPFTVPAITKFLQIGQNNFGNKIPLLKNFRLFVPEKLVEKNAFEKLEKARI